MGNINILGNDLERDPGLETSILISLFSNKRADVSDTLPDRSGDLQGWWGDTSTDKIGSKLWTLRRSSLTPDVPAKTELICIDALNWMVEDGVAKSIDVSTETIDKDRLLISIKVEQPDGQEKFYKYSIN